MKPFAKVECSDCRQHLVDDPIVMEAIASVAIAEHTTLGATLQGYLRVYHERGHRA